MSEMPPKSNNFQAYVVEKILNKRKRKGQTQYHIKWKGFEDDQNTWEPESNILDTALIHNFEQEITRAKSLKRQLKQAERNNEAKSAKLAGGEVADDNRRDAAGVSGESSSGTSSLATAVVKDDSASDGYASPTFEPTAGPSSTSGQHSTASRLLLKRYRVLADGSVEKIATRPVYVFGSPRPSFFVTRMNSEDGRSAAEDQVSSTTTSGRDLPPAGGPRRDVPTAAATAAEAVPDRVQSSNMSLEPVVRWSGAMVIHTEVTVRSETVRILECKTNVGFFKSGDGQED